MEPKQRLFIYDRREMAILVLLGALVSLFSFTLGVHLGKRVAVQDHGEAAKGVEGVKAAEEDIPSRQEIPEQSPKMDESTNAAVDDEIKKQVEETGLKIDHPRQVALPGAEKAHAEDSHSESEKPSAHITDESKNENKADEHAKAEHSTSGHKTAEHKPVEHKAESKSEAKSETKTEAKGEHFKYMLQVGSFPNEAEAKAKAYSLKPSHLSTLVYPVKIEGKGTWYRVYMGGYNTVDQANASGKELQKKGIVESFIVANTP